MTTTSMRGDKKNRKKSKSKSKLKNKSMSHHNANATMFDKMNKSFK